MEPNMEQIVAVPNEMIRLIPMFGGDKRQLNLFIRKSEYIISRYRGSETQNLYVYHAITSRLIDEAAALLSEREDIITWTELKQLLEQHFGDPRTEQCIALELESLKIKTNESYTEFCNRIQSVRSLLISKVNLIADEELKKAKISIYNNTSLNVFMYNLPENLVRFVRLKFASTLETALAVVLEETNFHEQYVLRNRLHNSHKSNNMPTSSSGINNKPTNAMPKYPFNQNQFVPKFKFGIPNQQPFVSKQPINNPQQAYRPPTFNPPQGFKQQIGYRPQLINPHVPMAPQQFGVKPNAGNNDVSMRTALSKPNRINELNLHEATCQDNEYCDGIYIEQESYENVYEVNEESYLEGNENFQIQASEQNLK